MFKRIVSCEECKCLLKKEDAQKVDYVSGGIDCKYYCQTHARQYETVYVGWTEGPIYYKEMRVDLKGNPVGYKKVEVKKL